MAGTPQASTTIDIRRLVEIKEDITAPQPAYEFSGHTIFKYPNAPGETINNRYVRGKDIDPSLR